MPSLRGRLCKFLLQHRHLLQGQLEKESIVWSQYEAIVGFRQQVEAGAGKFGKLPGRYRGNASSHRQSLCGMDFTGQSSNQQNDFILSWRRLRVRHM